MSIGIGSSYNEDWSVPKPKLKCYYAHPMMTYGSTIERYDVEMLQSLGFEVINPNQPKFQIGYDSYVKIHGKEFGMDYFVMCAQSCDIVAFRSLPDGRILSGVAKEVKGAMDTGIPIIELPCGLNTRMMDYPETKDYLIEIGFRKV